MRISKTATALAGLALLSACGGGGSNSGGGFSGPNTGGGGSGGGGGGNGCSLAERQAFVTQVFDEWYLFPDLLNQNANPSNYNTVQGYIDALVAPARAEKKDRFFSYITSISEENAFFNSGSSAGFGFRLFYDRQNNRVFIIETFEGTPALAADIDRGTELLGIGTAAGNIQSVNTLMATGGPAAVSQALGPTDPGVSRVLRIVDQDGVTREVSLTKAEFELDPISNRYGAKIINDNGKQVGYVNLRTFIGTANDDLRAAFAEFRAAGVTELIVDLRYNGGGAISVADTFGDLMGRDFVGEVFERITFRPSKSQFNEAHLFQARPQAIAPTRIAFIGTDDTASASEMVINGMVPYLGDATALIGQNTFGKPVGQSAFDKEECDDRVRAVTLKVENGAGNADYYTGLASTMPNTCRARDDFSHQLGDPQERMVAVALDFLAGRSCTPIAGTATTQSVDDRGLLMPDHPANATAAQRETPGLY